MPPSALKSDPLATRRDDGPDAHGRDRAARATSRETGTRTRARGDTGPSTTILLGDPTIPQDDPRRTTPDVRISAVSYELDAHVMTVQLRGGAILSVQNVQARDHFALLQNGMSRRYFDRAFATKDVVTIAGPRLAGDDWSDPGRTSADPTGKRRSRE